MSDVMVYTIVLLTGAVAAILWSYLIGEGVGYRKGYKSVKDWAQIEYTKGEIAGVKWAREQLSKIER